MPKAGLTLLRPGRRPGLWLLAIGVAVLHVLLANQLAQDRVGWGAGDAPPPRIEVAFVRELAAAPPPAVVVPAAVAKPRLAAVAAKPQAVASAPVPPAEAAASAPGQGALAATAGPSAPPLASEPPETPETPAPALAEAVPLPAPGLEPRPDVTQSDVAQRIAAKVVAEVVAASAPAADAAPSAAVAAAAPVVPAPTAPSAPAAVAFDWPPSTRMNYKLQGNYRGPVEGTAQVEWLRQGSRYQVHLSTAIGPVLSRHITSEGELTAQGLAPRRFDGEQKVLFRSPRRWQLRFGPELVQLSDGKQVPTQPGVQDEASQFVQLTWLFTTQPGRLRVGSAVEMPLAISKSLQRWIYDVQGEQVLRFPFGEVPTFHLKPRRAATGGDLAAEIWIAPSLQYLPVRIRITDTSNNWIDLTLETPPLQAAPAK